MKSARSGASAFGIVASAAIVSSGIAGSLLGGTAAEASTVSVAAPNVCGQPPAATSAARTVPAGHTAVVLDVASLPMSNTPKTKQVQQLSLPLGEHEHLRDRQSIGDRLRDRQGHRQRHPQQQRDGQQHSQGHQQRDRHPQGEQQRLVLPEHQRLIEPQQQSFEVRLALPQPDRIQIRKPHAHPHPDRH